MGFSERLAAIEQTSDESSPPGEEKADLCVRDEALFNSRDELVVNVDAYLVQVVRAEVLDMAHVRIAPELAVLPVVTGREWHDALA